jgi:hypothetical protein
MSFKDLSARDGTSENPIEIHSSDEDEPLLGVPKNRSVYMKFDGPVKNALDKTTNELRTVVKGEMELKSTTERRNLQRASVGSSPSFGPFSELDNDVLDKISTVMTDIFYPRLSLNEITSVAVPMACALIVREIEGLESLDEAKKWLAAYSHDTSY